MYNIHDYLAERKRGSPMTLEIILQIVKGTHKVSVLPSAHKSISMIHDEPFYVGTQFNQISSNRDPRFVLVSAPGATGKSAFGRYIAFIRNALYWNLSKINIGDGTFQGTLYKSLGVSKISSYANDLQLGNATLVIDAFDEAEIISGRKNVETFLFEANEFLENSSTPSIVLLSRTETAQNIATFFTAKKIPYIHYEIGYFAEMQARDFVLKSVEKRKNITTAIEECVDQYFKQVRTLISEKEIINRFLGYAPVLEAIAAHISEISNTAKLLSELNEGANEIALIQRIMNNLLEREQQKFVSALKERMTFDNEKVSDWNTIYSSEEQLVRLLNYVLLGEIDYNDYPMDTIPSYCIDEYNETVSLFLPQHPFIQNSFKAENSNATIDFAGPAFRDYVLAIMILKDDFEASAELYYQREAATSHFPSQLFWDHYIDISHCRIKSKHFSYLYEAYRSKISAGCQTYLDISQETEGTLATFRVIKKNETIDTVTLDVDTYDDIFVFDSVNNASISVDGAIILGQNENTHITDSTIFCKKIVVNANSLTIDSFEPCVTTISAEEAMLAPRGTPLNIIINGFGEIQVDVPNIYDFPKLGRFKHSFLESGSLDIYTFIHCLRRIFSSFRTHKKDMPARDAEKVDFVIIAGNSLKQEIFQFLLQSEVVFREAHLYKVNMNKMSGYGISWGALISTDIKQLQCVYDKFCEWRGTQSEN